MVWGRLAARLSRQVGAGVPRLRDVLWLVGTVGVADQPGLGRAASRWIAWVMTSVPGHRAVKRSQRRRLVVVVVTICAAAENSRRRSRLGFPAAGFCGQGEHRHPGEEVECEGDDLQPDPVLGGVVQGQVAQPGVAGVEDAVLAAGPAAVT